MNKRLIIVSLLFILATGFSIYALASHQQHNIWPTTKNSDNELILYYGDTCPHCKIVEEYLATNQITEKISIASKEVYNNQANADELIARAKTCELDTNSIGVPFLWTGQECLIGDQPIIDFLKTKLK